MTNKTRINRPDQGERRWAAMRELPLSESAQSLVAHLRAGFGDNAGAVLMHCVAMWVFEDFDPNDHDASVALAKQRSLAVGEMIHAYGTTVCQCPKCTKKH